MAHQAMMHWPASSTATGENVTASNLLEMLDRALADGGVVGITVIRRLDLPANVVDGGGRGELWAALTERQREIALLVAQALTNRQIARRIHISEHTVNYHLRQIFRRLQIGSRVELGRLTRG